MSTLSDYTGRAAPGPACSVCTAMARLAVIDPELHTQIQQVFDGDRLGVTDVTLHTAFQANGLRVGRQTIGHHRRGTCSGKTSYVHEEVTL